MNQTDSHYMQHALNIGARRLGQVWPNPAVGCVLVNDGHIVGRGWTRAGGAPHAETVALQRAGPQASGATAYVTLEPCSHHGNTPPCADALIEAGIRRVVVATLDQNPKVNGQGIARLQAAGIEVSHGMLEAAARRQHAGFMSRISRGRPLLTLKLAAGFDGRIATASGESRWITGPEARRAVHAMRARHDAVMIGAGTARSDDPLLTVRGIGVTRQPVRLVWSRQLDLPLQSQLAKTAADVPLWIVHAEGADSALCSAWAGLGARLFATATGSDGQLDPAAALQALGAAGLTRVLCEGGGALAASLLKANLVDEMVCFSAGIGLGGDALAMLAPMGLQRLEQAQRFELVQTRPIGGDTMTRWRAPVQRP